MGHPAEVTARQLPLGNIAPERLAKVRSRRARGKQAASTVRKYRQAQGAFARWCLAMDVDAMPAPVEAIQAYLDERVEERGWKPATVRLNFAGIADAHSRSGYGDIVRDPSFKDYLKGVDRDDARRQRQALPLTDLKMEAVRQGACRPRKGETEARARARGLLDIAALEVLRDGCLRVGEGAALVWDDIEFTVDGCATILIRKSKTDQAHEGKKKLLSPRAVNALHAARPVGPMDPQARVFGLSADSLGRRIRQVCEHVGLGPGYSGHSCRRGMVHDFAVRGIGMALITEAGSWASEKMVKRYMEDVDLYLSAAAVYYNLGPAPAGLAVQAALPEAAARVRRPHVRQNRPQRPAGGSNGHYTPRFPGAC